MKRNNGSQRGLLWINEANLFRLLHSAGAMYLEATWISIDGPDETIEVEVDLIYDEDEARWLAPMGLVEAVMAEEGWDPADIRGFRVGEEPVQAGLWLDVDHPPMPWSVYARAGQEMRRRLEEPPPTPEEVAALEPLPHAWQIGEQPGGWVYDEAGDPQRVYVVLVMEEGTRAVRQIHLKHGAPATSEELEAVVYRAAVRSMSGHPGRPQQLRVAGADLVRRLQGPMQRVGIPVTVGATPLLDDVFDEIQQQFESEEAPRFVGEDEATLRAFFAVARSFFNLKPWERVDGNKYIAFRLDEGPWGYLSILGQMGEQFGVSYFEDWLQICRLVHNQPTFFDALMEETLDPGIPRTIQAAGWMEGVTLENRTDLHPEDARYLDALGLKPLRGRRYPVPRHYSAEGMGPLRLPLEGYTAVMEALATVMKRRRTPHITSITKTVPVQGGTTVTLRFPADGTEALPSPVPGCRMIVEGAEAPYAPEDNALPPGARLEIDAPGDTPLHRIVAAIKRETAASGNRLWVRGVLDGAFYLWVDSHGQGGPSPPLIELAGRPNLQMEGLGQFPVRIMKTVGTSAETIRVRQVGAERR